MSPVKILKAILEGFKPGESKRKLILENQRSLIKLAKSRENIFLKPHTFGGGNVEHYYHFIFDLILPLSLLIRKTPSNVVFAFCEFGILSPLLVEIFADRVKLLPVDDLEFNEQKLSLMGMNPDIVKPKPKDLKLLKASLFKNLEISSCTRPNKILLIERLPPDPYYTKNATVKGSGSTRRSIRNHAALKHVIQNSVKPEFEFHNLQLEKNPFKKQLEYFDQAVLIIAQHGAGMSNIVWMKDKSVVVELGYNGKAHFNKVSEAKKHHYFLYNFKQKHIDLDVDKFLAWLAENPILNRFFINS